MQNYPLLNSSLLYLKQVLESRLKIHLAQVSEIRINDYFFDDDGSSFHQFIQTHHPTFEEYILLLLALTPHISPNFFQDIIAGFFPNGGDIPELGGVRSGNHRGILPTGETAQFVLAGDDIARRIDVQNLLSGDHWFAQKHILWLDPVREGEPAMSGRLVLDPEVVEILTTGKITRPRFSVDFPAEYIQTPMEWDDLVLHPNTFRQIKEIENWIQWNDTLLNDWGMKRKIKPGFRALFYGPPGTGKTLTAMLLGKYTQKEVFRIDLSRVVSKYIGETEKNLSKLFDKAEHKNWILFFDEADALFGKRTGVRDAHDKYANQEIAYLLQRVEGYNGLVILASNQRANIDEAFVRRFQAMIHFPMPRSEERCQIWPKSFPPQITIADDIQWAEIAARFELTGAGILNVAHYCAVELLASTSTTLYLQQLEAGIHRELVKEGKVS